MTNLFTTAGNNIEGNEEVGAVAGRDINSWTRPWQHDNAFVRLLGQQLRGASISDMMGTIGLSVGLCREILRGGEMKFDRFIGLLILAFGLLEVGSPALDTPIN